MAGWTTMMVQYRRLRLLPIGNAPVPHGAHRRSPLSLNRPLPTKVTVTACQAALPRPHHSHPQLRIVTPIRGCCAGHVRLAAQADLRWGGHWVGWCDTKVDTRVPQHTPAHSTTAGSRTHIDIAPCGWCRHPAHHADAYLRKVTTCTRSAWHGRH